jgi:hypothetical protein
MERRDNARTFMQIWLRMHVRRDRYVISDETLAHAEASLTASLQSNDPVVIAGCRFGLGFVHLWRGNLDSAEQELQASLPMAERTGDATTRVLCLTYLTIICRKREQLEQARRYALQSLERAAAAHMSAYVACAQGNLAWVAWREGDLPRSTAERASCPGYMAKRAARLSLPVDGPLAVARRGAGSEPDL